MTPFHREPGPHSHPAQNPHNETGRRIGVFGDVEVLELLVVGVGRVTHGADDERRHVVARGHMGNGRAFHLDGVRMRLFDDLAHLLRRVDKVVAGGDGALDVVDAHLVKGALGDLKHWPTRRMSVSR